MADIQDAVIAERQRRLEIWERLKMRPGGVLDTGGSPAIPVQSMLSESLDIYRAPLLNATTVFELTELNPKLWG